VTPRTRTRVRIAALLAAFVVAAAVTTALAVERRHDMNDPAQWPLTVAIIGEAMVFLWIVVPLACGRLVAAAFRMRCPRCGGGVSWLGSRSSPLHGRRRSSVCLHCNAFLRTRWTGNGWEEVR
jgi:hypothetical protein